MNTKQFRYDGATKFSADLPTTTDKLYTDDDDRDRQLAELAARMDQAQNRMHADGNYGLLVVLQALDAAGKDSSIRRVFRGVNPSRFMIQPFKKPEKEAKNHDFLWRFWCDLPERGMIGVFNRSYYEEVLAMRVHPERLREGNIPANLLPKNDETLWKQRFGDIVHFEDYLFRNGFPTVKLYLHISKEEQGKRLIARLSDPEKQWKFSENDLEERQFWPDYMRAFEDTINATATKNNPWYVIPSDDRHNQQIIIGHIVADLLESLPTKFPQEDPATAKKLIRKIEKQDKG